jgi:hypothetical protein
VHRQKDIYDLATFSNRHRVLEDMLFVASFHVVENDQDVEGSSRRFGGEERREASRDSRRMLDIRSV